MIIVKLNMVKTQGCYSLFTDIDSLMHEIKTEDVFEDFSKDKKCLILVIIQLSQNFIMILIN